MPINYAKWDKIEVSDDEDDTHPNVDTPSLFRWRHQARVEREEGLKNKRIDIDKEGDKLKAQMAKSKISDEEKKKKLEDWKKRERQIAEEERKQPHSVDTLSKDASSKTLISKIVKYEDYSKMTDEEKEESYKKFLKENKEKVKEFGMYRDPIQSRMFLDKNKQLICEHTSNYLVVWCIDLEMEEKTELMKHVANQTICMQFILELARGIQRHPTECFPLFYQKFIEAKKLRNSTDKSDQKAIDYYQAFESELTAFIDRVQKRAKVKLQEIYKEIEEEEAANEEKEKAERIAASPGGLDPQEVMDGLPEDLKKCFIERDTEMLQKILAEKGGQEYLEHLSKCVLSGLWVPGPESPLYRLIDPNYKHGQEVVEEVEENLEDQKVAEIKQNEKQAEPEETTPKIVELVDELDID